MVVPSLSGYACVQFAYHMYGTYIGKLKMFLEERRQGFDGGYNEQLVWELSRNQGDQWGFANASVHLGSELGIAVVRLLE